MTWFELSLLKVNCHTIFMTGFGYKMIKICRHDLGKCWNFNLHFESSNESLKQWKTSNFFSLYFLLTQKDVNFKISNIFLNNLEIDFLHEWNCLSVLRWISCYHLYCGFLWPRTAWRIQRSFWYVNSFWPF